jgi:CRP-like cAMP-binding protein
MDYKGLLKNIYLFIGAAPDDLDALGAVVELKTHVVGEIIFREGDVADALFVIERGSVDILQRGKEKALATFGSGQAFGELAFFDLDKRPASVSAHERSDILRISYEKFSQVLAARPELALLIYRNACKFLAKRFREAASGANSRYF